MPMLEIELSEPKLHRCDCCGGTTTTLVRFVHKDDSAHAIYYASFAESHPDRGAFAVVSIGPWWDGSDPADRAAFGLRLWYDETQTNVTVLDVADTPWPDKPSLGTPLTRAEALDHPLLQEVFHITDHMLTDDPLLIAFLRHQRPDA